jgi:hypothetical protein
MKGICNTCGRNVNCDKIYRRTLKGRDHSVNLSVDGKTMIHDGHFAYNITLRRILVNVIRPLLCQRRDTISVEENPFVI